MIQSEQDLIRLVQQDDWMMDILHAAKTLHLPDWWVCVEASSARKYGTCCTALPKERPYPMSTWSILTRVTWTRLPKKNWSASYMPSVRTSRGRSKTKPECT